MPRFPAVSRSMVAFALCGLSATMPPTATAADAPQEIVIGGTGAALGAMKVLGDAFMASDPGTRVRLVPSLGSGGGIKALAAGAIQVAVSGRPLTDEERAKGLVEREVIRTPLVFAVHEKAPTTRASLSELAEIYAGTRASWKDGTKTRPILRPVTDIDTEVVRNMSPAFQLAMKAAHQLPGKNVAVTDTDTADELERVPGAVGTSTLLLIKSEKRALKALDVDGVAASVDNMKSGKYAYTKSIYLITTRQSGATAKAFAAFVSSPAASRLVAENGGLQVPGSP